MPGILPYTWGESQLGLQDCPLVFFYEKKSFYICLHYLLSVNDNILGCYKMMHDMDYSS